MKPPDRLGDLIALAELDAICAEGLSLTLKTAFVQARLSVGAGAETRLGRRCAMLLSALATGEHGGMQDLLDEMRESLREVQALMRRQGQFAELVAINHAMATMAGVMQNAREARALLTLHGVPR